MDGRLQYMTDDELRHELQTAKIDLCYCHAARKLDCENPAMLVRRERANEAIIALLEAELQRRAAVVAV